MRLAHVSQNTLNQASAAGASKRAGWQADRLLGLGRQACVIPEASAL